MALGLVGSAMIGCDQKAIRASADERMPVETCTMGAKDCCNELKASMMRTILSVIGTFAISQAAWPKLIQPSHETALELGALSGPAPAAPVGCNSDC